MPAHEYEEDEFWQICDGCNSLKGTVTITPGQGRKCDSCRF